MNFYILLPLTHLYLSLIDNIFPIIDPDIKSDNLTATILAHLPDYLQLFPLCLTISQVINLTFMNRSGGNLIEKILLFTIFLLTRKIC